MKKMLLWSSLSAEQKREVEEQMQRNLEEFQREEEARWQRHREEAKRAKLRFMRLYDNVALFWKTEGLYSFDPNGRIASGKLYEIYRQWCITEKLPVKPYREFCLYTKQNAPYLRLTYTMNIPGENGKHLRGFWGVRELSPEESHT